jgi:MATE family multidrug resistance protein
MFILLAAPFQLIDIYLNHDDLLLDEVVTLAMPMVLIAALFQIPDGLQGIANSILRGMNDTRITAVLAISSFWVVGVGGGTLIGLGLGYGPVGVWSGLLLGLVAASSTLMWRVIRALRHLRAGGTILSD